MIRVGLIGVGFMGSTHNACYSALSSMMDIKVVAIADCVAEKREKASAKWSGVAVYETGMELIEKADVDVIDICLPTYLHTMHGVAAMNKGIKNVFIEKPVCLTEEEMAQLTAAQKKNKTRVMIGQVVRLFKEYEYLKKVKDNKELGALKSLSMQRLSPKPTWGWEEWLHDLKRSGSAVTDLHIHDVDFIRFLLGEPEKISAVGVTDQTGIPVHVFAEYQYDGCVAHAEGGWNYPQSFPFEAAFNANFEKGTLVFSTAKNPALTVYKTDGTMEIPVLESDFEASDDSLGGNISSLGGYFTELKYFAECIVSNKEPVIAPLSEGIASLRVINQEMAQILGE